MRLKEFMQKGGMINNPSQIQSVINKYSSGKSPLTAQDYIEVSKSTGVPVELLLAQGIAESSLGTAGRAVRTKNVGNVGNTDDGSATYANSWKDGLLRQAKLLRNEYGVKGHQDIQRMLDTRFARPTGGNYATDPNYSTKIAKILSNITGTGYQSNNQTYANQNTPQPPEYMQAPDTSHYNDLIAGMSKGLWDWTNPRSQELFQKAPQMVELGLKTYQTQQDLDRRSQLDNERIQQEQIKQQVEQENAQLQQAILTKKQERDQLLSMIPQAKSVSDGPVQVSI